MEKRKKAKFKVGDTVVVTTYGTVGKITDVKLIDQSYIYEVSKSEGLYMETSLILLSEYDGEIIDKEHIDIEYKFFFGDLVQVRGRGAELYKIIGFRTEIWRYQEDAWEDVIYELSSIKDDQWIEAGEEDLTLIADVKQADSYIQKLGFMFSNHPKINLNKTSVEKKKGVNAESKKKPALKQKMEAIDQLLDVYNDYKLLFSWFGSQEYKTGMNMTVKKLKLLAKEVSRLSQTNSS